MEQYVYERAVCTGLGDRVGALMTLATLARLHSVSIVFRWCGDPSEIFPSQHQHMPRWHGFDYNLSEFRQRFWPSALDEYIAFATPELSSEHKASKNKIIWNGLAVPAEAGLDQAYTTAWNAVQVPEKKVLDADRYQKTYRWVGRKVVLHAVRNHPRLIQDDPYIVAHMRGPDDNTYNSFLGCHDHPKLYCTRSVLKRLLKRLPGVKVFVVTNNATWAESLISHGKLDILTDTSAYDDFALLLGASAIVQHANYGWSSYSSNPSMMSRAPMITTFKRHLQHHRLALLEAYGGIPSEFYDCTRIDEFVSEAYAKIFHFI
jgi:hypothetical protein